MKDLAGKKWVELDEATREKLLSNANAIDGATGNTVNSTSECIIDFDNNISVEGKVVVTDDDIEIIINDDAVLYNCRG